ncbi:unnamed protein product, partial [Rotaria sp. Silwood1]
AYDRMNTNSQFNQPFNDYPSYQQYQGPQYQEPQYQEPQYQEPQYQEPQYQRPQQRMYESGPLHFSRSSEDLLSSPFDSMRYNTQPQYTS